MNKSPKTLYDHDDTWFLGYVGYLLLENVKELWGGEGGGGTSHSFMSFLCWLHGVDHEVFLRRRGICIMMRPWETLGYHGILIKAQYLVLP
jgi:hypothetical protein